MSEIGNLIKRVRLESGLTQADLARLASTKQPAIARLESGATTPTLRTVERLLDAMGKKLEFVTRPLEASESGVDRTLIFGNLRLSPADRLHRLRDFGEFVEALRRARRVDV